VVTDGTARGGTGDAVTPGDMTRGATDHSALDAAGGKGDLAGAE
jgi:hypothetical protein